MSDADFARAEEDARLGLAYAERVHDAALTSAALDGIGSLAMDRGDGMRFNIGTGEQTSVSTLYETMADITTYARPPTYKPERPGELRRIALDTRLAAAELGWKPWTTLREGLTETIDWLRG